MVERTETQETVLFGTLPGSVELQSSDLVPAPPPEIPGYHILSMLGRGGMGHVYLARHDELQRLVAVKIVAAGATATAEMLQRFRAEARAVAAVKHPSVCQIFETGQIGSVPFLAMEYVDGQTLAQSIRNQLPNPREAARSILKIAQALEACHQAGVIHRDLKPANVMLNREGIIKIMDFGLAKRLGEEEHRTRTGEIIGTPSYMAPEQASGVVKQFGPECDVYAIGAILYELLTGRPPFYTPDVMQTIMLVLTTDPIRPRNLQPRVPVDLETICLKCLEKQPRKRYSSSSALADDIQRFLDSKPILARRTPVWERAWKWARRHPALTALIVTGSLAMMAAAAGATFHLNRLQTELNKSERLFNRGLGLGDWLVNDHIPSVARLRGGNAQQMVLVAKALEYLSQLEQDAHGDQQLEEYIAQAYLRIAEVQADPAFTTRERIEQALISYARAFDAMHKLNPSEHPLLIQEQAAMLNRMSRLNSEIEEPDLARQQSDQAVGLLMSLSEQDHNNPKVLLTLLTSQALQAQQDHSDVSPAQTYRTCLDLFHSCENVTAPVVESAQRELLAELALHLAATIDGSRNSTIEDVQRTAIDYNRIAIEQLKWLTRHNPRRGQELAFANGQLARRLEQQEKLEEADQVLRYAIEQQKGLTNEIPESVILRKTLLDLLEQQFRVCEQLGDSSAALAVAKDHQQIADALYLSDPEEFRGSRQRSHQLLASAYRRWPHYDDALKHLARAIELAKASSVESRSPDEQRGLASMLWQQVEILREQDRAASTRSDTLRSLEQSIGILEECLAIHQQLDDAPVIPAESPYWEVLALKHRLEDQLDRWKIENREKADTLKKQTR